MRPIPLFAELCAGLASVSGVLQHGTHWKPPISRMGRKTGYAEAILRVMGLRPRQGAAHYLWAEADSDVAALLAAYTQPAVMREIADIIRSWIPCPYGPHEGWCSRCKGTGRWDARDLWETLRREKRRGLWDGGDAGEVAVNLALHGLTNPFPIATNAHGHPYNAGGGGFTFNLRPDWRMEPEEVARRTLPLALPWPPVMIAQSAGVSPVDVAGWLYLGGKAYDSAKFARSGAAAGGFWFGDAGGVGRERYPLEAIARDSHLLIWPPVHLTPSASIHPPQIPPGTVVYFDPPYANTTGYKHDLSRAEVLDIAERWASAGARVYMSEAEPLPLDGWHHVNIGGERKGQARTFGHTQEWLTCSHPPAWTPPKQGGLFG